MHPDKPTKTLKYLYTIYNRTCEYTSPYSPHRVYEWDVANEFLNQHFYEILTEWRDLQLMAKEFNVAHATDPDTRLCINDYRVLREGRYTSVSINDYRVLREGRYTSVSTNDYQVLREGRYTSVSTNDYRVLREGRYTSVSTNDYRVLREGRYTSVST